MERKMNKTKMLSVNMRKIDSYEDTDRKTNTD